MNSLILFGMYALGVIAGTIVTNLFISYGGVFKIDRSNPEKDLYLVDLKIDLDKLPKKKWIRLRIDAKADLSKGGQDGRY